MKILSLRLRGFIGLRDGSGIEETDVDISSLPTGLIAITGSNGSGKTTFLDNLHPYRIMPYKLRDRKDWSTGSFSYYDQCYGRNALKELIFEMTGNTYRAQILIDAEKKKTDAYLSIKNGADWRPLNDGKTKTFDAALEVVVGSPRLFFSSAFRAQGARSLSSYSRGDIISIVSELLVIDHIKEQSDKAGEVCKWLVGQISNLNGSLELTDTTIATEESLLNRQKTYAHIIITKNDLVSSSKEKVAELDDSIVSLKKRQATREADEATAAESDKLLNSLSDTTKSEESKLDDERENDITSRETITTESQTRVAEIERQKTRDTEAHNQIVIEYKKELADIDGKIDGLRSLIARKDEITGAVAELAKHEDILKVITKDLSGKRDALVEIQKKVETLRGLETDKTALEIELSTLKTSKESLITSKQRELTELRNKKSSLEVELENLTKERNNDIARIQISIKTAEETASRLNDLDCRADSAGWINETCPLLKDAVKAKGSIVYLNEELSELDKDTSDIDRKKTKISEVQTISIDPLVKDIAGLEADTSAVDSKLKEISSIQVKIDNLLPSKSLAVTTQEEITNLDGQRTSYEEKIRISKETASLIHGLNNATEKTKELSESVVAVNKRAETHKTNYDNEIILLDGNIKEELRKRDEALAASTKKWLEFREKQLVIIESSKKAALAQEEVCSKLKDSLDEDLSLSIAAKVEEKDGLETTISGLGEELQESNATKAVIDSDLGAVATAKTTSAAIKARICSYEKEMANWMVLQQACSNNGIIALEIDDAGPSIAALANKLLASCYGTRFSVRIETQGKKADGTLKEDFDITVFDSENGKDKSIKDMSGGEVTWIEDAITKAICLYRMERSDMVFDTIFTDEKDGSLDEQKKNEFFAIKKQMLTIGHHKQEFFITQTPDLQEQADARILISSGEIRLDTGRDDVSV
jgi:exonuclease SbcC